MCLNGDAWLGEPLFIQYLEVYCVLSDAVDAAAAGESKYTNKDILIKIV